jgi:hypothetical protein
LILIRLPEHPLEGLPRTQQPPLAECFPILATQKWLTFHGDTPKKALET